MNDPNKHKPLSAEELFKLLEEKNSDSSSLTGLDDFEREALEGFSKYSSLDKAKLLTDEINTSISHLVSEKKPKPSSKIAWFSAAASVVILILLSVYFLTETAKTIPSNLALNKDVSEPQKQQPQFSSAETEPAAIAPPVSSLTTSRANTVQTKNAATVNTFSFGIQEKTFELEGKTEAAKGDYKLRNLEPGSLKQNSDNEAERVAGNISQIPVLNDATLLREEQQESDNAADKSVTKSAVTETQGTVAQQGYDVNASINKAKQNDAKKSEKGKNKDMDLSYSSAPASGKALEVPPVKKEAYYKGGTNAIKQYVINRLTKNDKATMPGPSVYKINILVFANGKIKVITVSTNSSEQSNIKPITEALNSMTGWNPEVIDNKACDSNLAIELKF